MLRRPAKYAFLNRLKNKETQLQYIKVNKILLKRLFLAIDFFTCKHL